jgi:F0F1-type ATP synthase delta subunit
MPRRLSRRVLAEYVVRSLQDGVAAEALVRQLAGYLVESRRTKEAELVVRDIEVLLADNGMVVGTITSAFSLSEATERAITDLIASETGANRVELNQTIDPSVIGGYKVTIPGQVLDQTIATLLSTLKTHSRKV